MHFIPLGCCLISFWGCLISFWGCLIPFWGCLIPFWGYLIPFWCCFIPASKVIKLRSWSPCSFVRLPHLLLSKARPLHPSQMLPHTILRLLHSILRLLHSILMLPHPCLKSNYGVGHLVLLWGCLISCWASEARTLHPSRMLPRFILRLPHPISGCFMPFWFCLITFWCYLIPVWRVVKELVPGLPHNLVGCLLQFKGCLIPCSMWLRLEVSPSPSTT